MKVLTLNFLTCARKACKSSAAAFPLHPRDAELEVVEAELNPAFIRNILPRLEWEALRGLAAELGLPALPPTAPELSALGISPAGELEATETDALGNAVPTPVLRDLHTLLLETTIASGALVCANCGHEYAVKEGIANFLLPSHLV
ncbi:uncharacterized protein K452DRAFT_227748 [Aplosporella prunicola CBS 121167]|uniref:Trm112p-like protein n=1 Tax=Aplosporella prunicola CBS 121167 TaxID=1176127 RepID=A0A6A6BEZ3_9PEZI|nr:uncharacterized protein K452DRAFT_227748 [Aplosporella prunicola CBS 121167]KAF2142138.1 hypothetical protein K452DRAFT_227748 [Aplosporella prunicola CBS 121167]